MLRMASPLRHRVNRRVVSADADVLPERDTPCDIASRTVKHDGNKWRQLSLIRSNECGQFAMAVRLNDTAGQHPNSAERCRAAAWLETLKPHRRLWRCPHKERRNSQRSQNQTDNFSHWDPPLSIFFPRLASMRQSGTANNSFRTECTVFVQTMTIVSSCEMSEAVQQRPACLRACLSRIFVQLLARPDNSVRGCLRESAQLPTRSGIWNYLRRSDHRSKALCGEVPLRSVTRLLLFGGEQLQLSPLAVGEPPHSRCSRSDFCREDRSLADRTRSGYVLDQNI